MRTLGRNESEPGQGEISEKERRERSGEASKGLLGTAGRRVGGDLVRYKRIHPIERIVEARTRHRPVAPLEGIRMNFLQLASLKHLRGCTVLVRV